MTTGVVTNEQIKEVFDNDARIVATLDKDTCNSREEALRRDLPQAPSGRSPDGGELRDPA